MIRLRALIQTRSRSLLLCVALTFVGLILAWAHSAPAAHEMPASGEDQMAEVVSICLAVLQVGAGLLAAAVGAVLLARRRPPTALAATGTSGVFVRAVTPPVAARAGPSVLQVFRR
jgi:hypothetical protein